MATRKSVHPSSWLTRIAARRKTNVAKMRLPGAVSGKVSTLIGAILAVQLLTVEAFLSSRATSQQRSEQRWFSASSSSSSSTLLESQGRELGFLSFDLDDTLFPTSEVVQDANAVMVAKMAEHGCVTTIPTFVESTRTVRNSLTQPVTYSDLRRKAIAYEMERVNPGVLLGEGAAMNHPLVEECFDAWLTERHAAAGRRLFPDAIAMLQSIRERYPDVCIAAITNGRGNPLEMESTLQPYFDFCVSGEDDDVFPNRKPHPGIYEQALEKYAICKPHHRLSPSSSYGQQAWCHVGDCLANDVGASASCGALAVWYAPESDELDEVVEERKKSSYSTASKSEYSKRAQLAEAARPKIATRISNLGQLEGAIDELLVGVPV